MIIDAHTHVANPCLRDSADGLSLDEYVAIMDEYGVDKVWISPTAGLYGTGEYPASNRFIYEFTKGREDRFVPFFTVNPNYGESTLSEIKRCVEEYGMRGIKLHPWLQSFQISLPIVDRITEACINHNLPMIFHDGTPPYSSPLQIANLAERYPEATVILGHSGLIEMYANAILAAKRLKNVYLCLCGPSISHLQLIVDSVDPSKIMFGTDFGLSRSPASLRYRKKMWDYVKMDDGTRDMVFYKNAQSLLP